MTWVTDTNRYVVQYSNESVLVGKCKLVSSLDKANEGQVVVACTMHVCK